MFALYPALMVDNDYMYRLGMIYIATSCTFYLVFVLYPSMIIGNDYID